MKLQICSDLHNEISVFDPFKTDADVIVLAGDIWKGARGIGWAREEWPDKEIVYVPGNHEFYGAKRPDTLAEMHIVASECGVHMLDNDEVIINGVRFLGSTLWTDFELYGASTSRDSMNEGIRYLNDFRVIHEGVRHFSPTRSVELHKESLNWLMEKLGEPFDGKTVVVTHHLPSMRSVAERYKAGLLSACFASNLDHLFGKMDLWVHGHTHDNFDYMENGTRVVCNPRGYVSFRGEENIAFDPELIVEV